MVAADSAEVAARASVGAARPRRRCTALSCVAAAHANVDVVVVEWTTAAAAAKVAADRLAAGVVAEAWAVLVEPRSSEEEAAAAELLEAGEAAAGLVRPAR